MSTSDDLRTGSIGLYEQKLKKHPDESGRDYISICSFRRRTLLICLCRKSRKTIVLMTSLHLPVYREC
jgi:hypothetical protein